MLASPGPVRSDTSGVPIYTLTSAKGGVGKTTAAVHLAAYLADRSGLGAVALLDCDPQGSSSRWAREAVPGMAVAHAVGRELAIEHGDRLAAAYPHLVIDAPGGVGEEALTAILLADAVLIPVGPSALDLRAAASTVALIRQAQSLRKRAGGGGPRALAFGNRLQAHTRLSREVADAMRSLGVDVAHAALGHRVAVADAPGQSAVVWNMSNAHQAAAEWLSLCSEVVSYAEAAP